MPSHKPKKYADSRRVERQGVNQVEKVVLDMNFVWNEILVESGIDGQIEIVNTADGSATNRIVMVQVKAVLGQFQAESESHCSYSCERAHIDYWMNGTAPVILVVCRPSTGDAYWKNVKAYFSDPTTKNETTIRFDKAKDQFNSSCGPQLANLATPDGGHYLGNLPKAETLISNLFPVEQYPDSIWTGIAKTKSREAFLEALKALKSPWLREIVLEGDTVYSFYDLSQSPIDSLVEKGTIERNDSQSWAASDIKEQRNIFVKLLNKCLAQLCFHRGISLIINDGKHLYFCDSNEDKSERKIRGRSLKQIATRTVASWYPSKMIGGTGLFKHAAFSSNWFRAEERWFLELTPTFVFTSDGRTLHKNSGKLLKNIKERERHRSVVGNLLAWRTMLLDTELALNRRYELLELGEPEEFILDVGIDDIAWQKDKDPDKSLEIAEEESPQTELF